MAQYLYPFLTPNHKFQKMRMKLVGNATHNAFPGDGALSGIVTENEITPKQANLTLYDVATGNFVKSTQSNVSTGYYEFTDIDKTRTYDVVAADPTNEWEKKVSSLRAPATAIPSISDVRMYADAHVSIPTLAFDPYLSNVVLCMRFQGADGTSTFTEDTGKGTTPFGNAQHSTTQAKFGTSSLALDGSGDYVDLSDSSDFDFGVNPFTVEGWIYFSTAQTNWVLASQWSSSTSDQGWAVFGDAGTFKFRFRDAGGTHHDVDYTWTPTAGQWYHIAATRNSSNVFRTFIDGTQVGSATYVNQIRNSPNVLRIGSVQDYPGTYDVNGYIGGLRITKNICRYTGNFTPPTTQFALK